MSHFVTQIGLPILGSIAVLVWWLTVSRAPLRDRWLPAVLFVLPAALLTGPRPGT
jgi:hypothetical protein